MRVSISRRQRRGHTFGDLETLRQFGAEVKIAANQTVKVRHPHIPEINHIYGTIIHGAPRLPGSTQANCCVFADREIDRSPTGSGTAGRIAQLYLRGQIAAGEELVNESLIGSVFKAKVVCETRVDAFKAVIPQIEGTAFICGFANWIIDPRDELGGGFLVR